MLKCNLNKLKLLCLWPFYLLAALCSRQYYPQQWQINKSWPFTFGYTLFYKIRERTIYPWNPTISFILFFWNTMYISQHSLCVTSMSSETSKQETKLTKLIVLNLGNKAVLIVWSVSAFSITLTQVANSWKSLTLITIRTLCIAARSVVRFSSLFSL